MISEFTQFTCLLLMSSTAVKYVVQYEEIVVCCQVEVSCVGPITRPRGVLPSVVCLSVISKLQP
jgi:hypothetical protein